jgi:predicted DNA-binding ribbon-helix-helix protein
MKSSNMKKHNVTIAGHKTSVSIEDAFWKGLREIANGRGQTLYGLITDINVKRQSPNLASAIRLFVLQYYRDQFDQRGGIAASLGPSNFEDDAHSGVDLSRS